MLKYKIYYFHNFNFSSLQINEIESNIQINHLRKLLNLIDVTNEIQRNIITKMTEQYNQHHILLRGFNKVTNSMAGEHKVLNNLRLHEVIFNYIKIIIY